MITRIFGITFALLFAYGPAAAKFDDTSPPDTITSAPLPESKEDNAPAPPEPKPELPTCATPRDGQDSKDEGERVMCDHSLPT